MTKTLLIVFVHGFRGGNDTFGSFPTHLRALVSHRLPDIHVVARVYPQYETRGELAECVSRFRDWLQNEVIDLEVASGAPSPTIDPSVHVMIVGHSMGGIVAAETILAIAAEQPLPPTGTSASKSSASMGNSIGKVPDALGEPTAFMFPHIQGLLAFDTPFLGICPGVVSYTAESHYKKASAAVNTITDVVGALGLNKNNNNTNSNSNSNSERNRAPRRSNTMPSSSSSSSNPASARRGAEPVTTGDAATVPAWHKLGKYAMFAGAAGALAAGGAAAAWYAKREQFREGWSWATGHLEFVSCLRRPEALKRRVEEFGVVQRERGIGGVNFFTALGRGAEAAPEGGVQGEGEGAPSLQSIAGCIRRAKERTFCNLPREVGGLRWVMAVNEGAKDEIAAHTSMFSAQKNPGFYELAAQAAMMVVQWVDRGWYAQAARERREREKRKGKEKARGGDVDGDAVLV